ncbi:MAG TPA: sodium/proton-translocating pyrophosphatase, partial [Polyangiaceae bacterium]|nr:sodium/proton-translocating pyrophosphatase [Polyangiaceae bacterium]
MSVLSSRVRAAVGRVLCGPALLAPLMATLTSLLLAPSAWAQEAGEKPHHGGEASLVLPDIATATFQWFGGGTLDGRKMLTAGLVVCLAGMAFGLVIFNQLKNLPVHKSMREISELIYETCKAYMIQQGKFLLILEVFIGVIIFVYFGVLRAAEFTLAKTLIILAFSLVGIAGSYGVAWFGIRVNTFANSRTAYASLGGKPFPTYSIPLKAGMSIGMLLISVELVIMLAIFLWVPRDLAGPCFIGFAIGESLGAAALRIAGGIFTKIADIGSDL